jgi:hypothetical protein
MKLINMTSPGLAGGTLIQTACGVRRINDRNITPYPTPMPGRAAVQAAVKITTASGKSLTGSREHRILTIHKTTRDILPIPISQVTKNHHLIGAAVSTYTVLPEREEAELSPTENSRITLLSYEKQVAAITNLLTLIGGRLSLKLTSPHRTPQFASMVSMMGCHAFICTETNIIITPLSEDAPLNRFLMIYHGSSSFYNQEEALRCRGLMANSTSLPSGMKSDLDQFLSTPSVLYAEQVVSIANQGSLPLWDLRLCSTQPALANGFIVTGAAN